MSSHMCRILYPAGKENENYVELFMACSFIFYRLIRIEKYDSDIKPDCKPTPTYL